MNDNQDLLDLCRLNLMEKNVEESCAYDKDTTLAAINYKKRHLVTRLKASTMPATKKLIERHRETNTVDGICLGDQ